MSSFAALKSATSLPSTAISSSPTLTSPLRAAPKPGITVVTVMVFASNSSPMPKRSVGSAMCTDAAGLAAAVAGFVVGVAGAARATEAWDAMVCEAVPGVPTACRFGVDADAAPAFAGVVAVDVLEAVVVGAAAATRLGFPSSAATPGGGCSCRAAVCAVLAARSAVLTAVLACVLAAAVCGAPGTRGWTAAFASVTFTILGCICCFSCGRCAVRCCTGAGLYC
mmetsp:Transcript_57510/g.141026  ORF Transcript_57510/g.141026 Transcript_57510/m.141026 type:complete len:224 (-) Transcript_57510:92-763(-)